MKIEYLKKLLKETVKEVFQEELKGVLVEIIKAQTSNNTQTVQTQNFQPTNVVPIKESGNVEELRNKLRGKYSSILEQTTPFNAQEETQKFIPRGNGELGAGELDESQIMSLLSPK